MVSSDRGSDLRLGFIPPVRASLQRRNELTNRANLAPQARKSNAILPLFHSVLHPT
jgi:hypothetical protein